jgi:hypothetical protein
VIQPMKILAAMKDPLLFRSWFAGDSWNTWIVVLKALFAVAMNEMEQVIYGQISGRKTVPSALRELWILAGRRSGKTTIAGFFAIVFIVFRDWEKVLKPGETGVAMAILPDRAQARVLFGYVEGFVDHVPMIRAMVAHRTQNTITFTNRIRFEVRTANFRTLRGYTVVLAIVDEAAFLRDDASANPFGEILTALRPAMATTGGLLIVITTPYARTGPVWTHYEKFYGKESERVLFVTGPSQLFNPLIEDAVIEQALEEDESAARAEWFAEFRRNVEGFVSLGAIQNCVVPGRHELPPTSDCTYYGFVDPSGGSADSFTLAIAHQVGDRYRPSSSDQTNSITFGLRDELSTPAGISPLKWKEVQRLDRQESQQNRDSESGKVVLDLVREVKPPFSPEGIVKEFCQMLKAYRISEVTGDKYAGEWPREQFRKYGIEYQTSEYTKSELYQALLPLLNSGRVELLDSARLKSRLLGLERRTARSGRDSIDHGPGTHDDVINSAAGAIVAANTHEIHCSAAVKLGGVY